MAATAGTGKLRQAFGHAGRRFTVRTAPADAGERLPSRAGDAAGGTILLTVAGLNRLGRRPRDPALMLQGTGRPGLATGAGSHGLLGGRWRHGLLGQRERGDEE